uniref:Uncharacterized protein n=1 Tax=Glossina palpalis gambiensis TaxID=67801 RepID=A0A1B0BL54_9MUSC
MSLLFFEEFQTFTCGNKGSSAIDFKGPVGSGGVSSTLSPSKSVKMQENYFSTLSLFSLSTSVYLNMEISLLTTFFTPPLLRVEVPCTENFSDSSTSAMEAISTSVISVELEGHMAVSPNSLKRLATVLLMPLLLLTLPPPPPPKKGLANVATKPEPNRSVDDADDEEVDPEAAAAVAVVFPAAGVTTVDLLAALA